MTFSEKVSIITYYEYKKEKLDTLSVHCEQTKVVALTGTCPRGDDIKSGFEKFSTLSAYPQGGGADKDCLYSISSGCGGGGLGKCGTYWWSIWKETSGKNLFGGTLYNGQVGSNGGWASSTNRITNISASGVYSDLFLEKGTYTISMPNLDFC